ncbi:TPA: hypothetical protein HA335_00125 [Methanocaldococcus jannaschii]|uniref:Uncharacterized protein MJ1288.1 n=2 Tax=Methanocaldococcus jannaschii TaxID=2190 RepID=YC8C_METJA|nr:hypothetical protein [Methanocaldococcus jannaschii]P81320.1 RecName: Full=Uncharacterized protein MJ1288.1 [Methanocaldococcus jannaschii DSM 2661]AAB99300.1 hypothetical protein MJ_1288.1 [Methanocaldococcus jannaschii DSM 2661]HII58987.1 hypothetical protein [Methanocaldococcus jannaschii]
MHIIAKSILLMAVSFLVIIFTSTIYSELIEIGKYRYIDKVDREITSEVMNAVVLANEGNITLYKKINLNCKVIFENNSFTIIFQNKTYVHKFNNNIRFFKNEISDISKISCKKVNNTYMIYIE